MGILWEGNYDSEKKRERRKMEELFYSRVRQPSFISHSPSVAVSLSPLQPPQPPLLHRGGSSQRLLLFLPSSLSHLLSTDPAWTSPQGKYKKGKNKSRTANWLEDDEVPEDETNFPRDSGHVTTGATEFVWADVFDTAAVTDWMESFCIHKTARSLERDTCWD